ncbi:hypothetical protein OC845_006596 [Tilletia horrida]|nr:hypothetical protein OC845_006596 [Tilletia horrida]
MAAIRSAFPSSSVSEPTTTIVSSTDQSPRILLCQWHVLRAWEDNIKDKIRLPAAEDANRDSTRAIQQVCRETLRQMAYADSPAALGKKILNYLGMLRKQRVGHVLFALAREVVPDYVRRLVQCQLGTQKKSLCHAEKAARKLAYGLEWAHLLDHIARGLACKHLFMASPFVGLPVLPWRLSTSRAVPTSTAGGLAQDLVDQEQRIRQEKLDLISQAAAEAARTERALHAAKSRASFTSSVSRDQLQHLLSDIMSARRMAESLV